MILTFSGTRPTGSAHVDAPLSNDALGYIKMGLQVAPSRTLPLPPPPHPPGQRSHGACSHFFAPRGMPLGVPSPRTLVRVFGGKQGRKCLSPGWLETAWALKADCPEFCWAGPELQLARKPASPGTATAPCSLLPPPSEGRIIPGHPCSPWL